MSALNFVINFLLAFVADAPDGIFHKLLVYFILSLHTLYPDEAQHSTGKLFSTVLMNILWIHLIFDAEYYKHFKTYVILVIRYLKIIAIFSQERCMCVYRIFRRLLDFKIRLLVQKLLDLCPT